MLGTSQSQTKTKHCMVFQRAFTLVRIGWKPETPGGRGFLGGNSVTVLWEAVTLGTMAGRVDWQKDISVLSFWYLKKCMNPVLLRLCASGDSR